MRTRQLFGTVILAAFIAAVLLWAMVQSAAENAAAAARSNVCQHRLAFIYRALRSYHDKYGKFPPAYIADKKGKPMHSWRVLVLETLGEPQSTEVYRAYNFDEPWDGPNNRKLLDRMPDFYACPSNRRGGADRKPLANYVLIVGPGAVFRGAESLAMSQISDIHSDTIVLAETLPGVPWLEPRDLEFDKMSFQLDDPAKPSIAGKDSTGCGVVLLDGRVERLHKPADPDRIRSMLVVKLKAPPPGKAEAGKPRGKTRTFEGNRDILGGKPGHSGRETGTFWEGNRDIWVLLIPPRSPAGMTPPQEDRSLPHP